MYEALVVIQYISILLLTVESIYIFIKWRTRLQSYLFLYCLSTLINNVGYLAEMTASTSEAALYSKYLSYFGRVWIPLSFFVFIMEFCKVKLPGKLYTVLAAVHMGTFVLVITSRHQRLYYTGYEYVQEGLFPHNVFGHGPWYVFYMSLLGVYSVTGIAVLVRTIIKEKNKENRCLQFYILASAITEVTGFVVVMAGITRGYDVTVLAYTIGTVFMYIALFKHNLMDTLDLVKDYVIDNLSEGIIAVDEKESVIYFNEPLTQIYPDLTQRQSQILAELKAAMENKSVLQIGGKVYMPEMQPLYCDGVLRGKVYALIDQTEQQRYTQELMEQKELAEAANASKSAFLSIVSHEIRTPMNAVVGMTDLLLRDELTEKQRKYMLNIKNSGTALVMIINDILDQSKLEAGKMEIVEDVYELRPMVEDVQMIIEDRIGSKPIHLMIHIDERIPAMLVGDALRLRQIFINLMNNAVKFTESGYIQFSATLVSADEEKMAIRFGIKDSGQGIRREDLDKLGKAFSQVDTKRNHSKEGTGLGLSISRDFISLMGGQLQVESTYGKGSEFYFTINQGKADAHDENCRCDKCTWKQQEFTAKSARVLIVDDTNLNLMIASELLQPIGMTIDTASSGEKAIELIQENCYQLVFMDYMMPGMDGVEATDRIRKLASKETNALKAEYYESLPIIALSGDISERTQEMFQMAGINDFLEKPVEADRLKSMLLKWLPEEMIEGQ